MDDKEASRYWGYLFKWDKTGTDKLRKLLRALHSHIATHIEPHDSRDLTPTQLAQFYRELNGNYDQLFIQIPVSTIAFIYKNLGCVHSLQPLPAGTEKRFSDPTIPALKEEGWIMWETIQLLLGPDEHAGFLMDAVKKWDLQDPDDGSLFPKVLPRGCFPAAPDPHMVAWYEGVSDRLRREAEEEQSVRIKAVEDEPRRQIEAGEHRRHDKSHADSSDDEQDVVTKKSSALAYFKNPLFRNKEGRPGVVRRNSKQPTLVERGKSAASSVGHVVRNIASPSLWDGHSMKEKDHPRDRDHAHRERDRDPRRKSLPHSHRLQDDDDLRSQRLHPRQAALSSRRGSATNSPISDRDYGEASAQGSPRDAPSDRHHQRHASSPTDHQIRHSKSHDPTPSPRDYFPPYETYRSRRGSAQTEPQSPGGTASPGRTPLSAERPPSSDTDTNLPTGFMPTASPLFATHVARNTFNRPSRLSTNTTYGGAPPRTSTDRDRYESPARSDMGRSSSTRRNDRRDSTRTDPGDGTGGQRPKVTRFENGPKPGHARTYNRDGGGYRLV